MATDTKLDASERLVFNKVPTTMGETVSLTSQNKKTVIYFFAPWCSVCHLSIGNLQSLYEKNPQLDVIAVALDFRDTKEVIDFTKEHQLTFPIALGNEQIKHAFSVSAYPSYYVINEHNSVIWKSMGYSSELGLYLRSL
ncbi:TlpA family protein disulfide reductase [Colwellia sp. MSW7]|uniref:TlpA family protein disulfide reductase n=1 Tax=Colwellia maritima TaxID=2912588 RepID=A0ABS9X4A4_9GAMM|nr:TlpA disulfide reductase family protein [Colwellia maritima]MCI2284291.1 TlpA family protein disulfide reductase [Colwellia maritima]